MSERAKCAVTHGDVHVRYRLTDALGDDDWKAAAALLSDCERTRYERFRVDRDRHEYAVAHALLRTTLSEFGGLPPHAWRFDTGPNGKAAVAPVVCPSPLSFNLSHTHGLVACLVSSSPGGVDVGVDVERITRSADWRGIAGRYFSTAEILQIDRALDRERPTRFFELWTLKEAFIKAVGVGLS